MSARKDSVCGDVASFDIGGKGFYVIAAVRQNRHQALHPIRVFRKSFDACKWFGLAGKGRVRSTVNLADFPTFSRFAGDKEIVGNCADRGHERYLSVASSNLAPLSRSDHDVV